MTDENETQDERENRELIELLNEVRVVLPGVQVLVAFLLTLAFSSAFETIDDVEKFTYLVAFFSTAGASILLMTPTAFHRIRFRQGDKEALLRGDPERFYTTSHYDGHAYILVRLAITDARTVAELIEDAWRLTAPKRLLAAYDGA